MADEKLSLLDKSHRDAMNLMVEDVARKCTGNPLFVLDSKFVAPLTGVPTRRMERCRDMMNLMLAHYQLVVWANLPSAHKYMDVQSSRSEALHSLTAHCRDRKFFDCTEEVDDFYRRAHLEHRR